MPDEQVVAVDPPPSPQTAVNLTNILGQIVADIKKVHSKIESFLDILNNTDAISIELYYLRSELTEEINCINSYYQTESFRDLINNYSLENLSFHVSRNHLVEILVALNFAFEQRNSERFLSNVKLAFEVAKLIRELLEKISKYRIFRLPPADNASKSIFEEYKLVGGCIHSRNDHVLSNIQEYIDKISLPLYNFTSSGVPATFLAFVGPSLTGKSQSAFALAYGQPVLYFNFEPASQSVYNPFSDIFFDIDERLSQDLDKFRTELKGNKFPGAEFLFTKMANVPFKSLGLLWALTEAGLNYEFEDPNKYWFDDYLNLNLLMEDELSINDFKSKFSN